MKSKLIAGGAAVTCLLVTMFALLVRAQDDKVAQQKPDAHHATEAPKVTPAEARKLLVEGNARFAAGATQHPRQTPARRAELSASQHPVAVILGCADSRTGPEILFDQGLGDLFVVREAGNVVDDHALGSIEYAVEHLHTPLIIVLGHERCGAIGAARDTLAAHAHAEGHIESLVAAIRPAVEATAGQDAEATCKANVRNVVKALRSSDPLLRHMAQEGKVEVLGAYYDLDTGTVTFLDE
jgi:carbonic anhydrase